MSRQTVSNERYTVAFGHDHAVGLFVQVFDNTLPDGERDEPIVDLDAMFHGLTYRRMFSVADEYGLGDEVERMVRGV